MNCTVQIIFLKEKFKSITYKTIEKTRFLRINNIFD